MQIASINYHSNYQKQLLGTLNYTMKLTKAKVLKCKELKENMLHFTSSGIFLWRCLIVEE